jgi:hypothetical protein
MLEAAHDSIQRELDHIDNCSCVDMMTNLHNLTSFT